jgi:hypothetical protein
MRHICIVGTGVAGLQLLLLLTKKGVRPDRIWLVDSFHDGGDLKRKWSSVKSNTTWRQITNVLSPNETLPEPWKSLDPDKNCILDNIIEYIRWLAKPLISKCNVRTGTLTCAENLEDGTWKLQFQDGGELQVGFLFLCTGSDPKTLDLPVSSIPLEVALDISRLSRYVKPHHRILVFGLSHSGTLIAANCETLKVHADIFYHTPKPFIFARDGEYDGIKEDSAQIADEIVRGNYKYVKIHSTHDVASLIRASRNADYVIYAIGFQSRKILKYQEYDAETGKLGGVMNGWGFGIGFPSRASDGIHYDVSVPSFQAHLEKQLPNILSLVGIDE